MKIIINTIFIALLSTAVLSAQGYQEPLAIGSEAPYFEGIDQSGNEVTLESALQDGRSAVMIFYRGSWCGYCKKHLSELQDSLELVLAASASVIVVSPELPESSADMIEHTGATFSILHDEDYSIMQAYHVDYMISEETVFKFLGPVTKRTAKANGNDEGVLPVPATYIIGNDGQIKWVHFDPDYSKRSTVAEILENLN